MDNENAPFLNRALCAYSVGSVFKLVTAAAALESGFTSGYMYCCSGSTEIYGQRFRCHNMAGHGLLDMENAMVNSCNPYFINLSQILTADAFHQTAEQLGFGIPISLADGFSSSAGYLQSVQELHVEAEKANLAFGQGKLLATPLHIAAMTACIANDGVYHMPWLLRGETTDGVTLQPYAESEPCRVLCTDSAQTLQKLMCAVLSKGEGQNGVGTLTEREFDVKLLAGIKHQLGDFQFERSTVARLERHGDIACHNVGLEVGTDDTVLESQRTPDGNFPTVASPNPEERTAMELAIRKADEIKADLVLATDPDADRVGIAVRNNNGKMVLLNGNMTGSLLVNYVLSQWEKGGKLTGNEFTVKTIVTTELIREISNSYGVSCPDVLTGFKYIAEQIENTPSQRFIVGGEESYGYLVSDFVRDKDAVSACIFTDFSRIDINMNKCFIFRNQIGLFNRSVRNSGAYNNKAVRFIYCFVGKF